MNAPPRDLTAAHRALETGNLPEARKLLREVLRHEPQNYRAWLWLAGITPTPAASYQYIQRAQSLRPNDPAVLDAMRWAEQRVRASEQQYQPPVATESAALVPHQPERVTNLPTEPIRSQPQTPASNGFNWWPIIYVVILVGVLLLAWQLTNLYFNNGGAFSFTPPISAEIATQEGDEPTEAPTLPANTPTVAAPTPAKPLPAIDESASGLRPKNGVRSVEPLPTWQLAPTATPEPTATSIAPEPVESSATEARWIDVDLSQQRLTAYEYNQPIYTSLITSGSPNTPTIVGQFRIYAQIESQTMSGYHLGFDYAIPNVPHVMYFSGDYALHGAYWRDTFGVAGSHGCVNLPTDVAAWLYDFADVGTLVNIHY